MIEAKTVLILGAGASYPYGFPLGEQLKHIICDELKQPNAGSVKQIENLGYDIDQILEFSNILHLTPTPSVDAFLEHREDFIELGKIAIAQELKKYENTQNLFGRIQGDWYKYLFEKINAPFDEFGNNKISIITFNYDRSIEHYLFTALKHLSQRDPNECADKLKEIPIIHLYGKLGDLPHMGDKFIKYDTGAPNDMELSSAAKGIRIISEKHIDNSDFRQARQLIYNADTVCFIGFGYNRTNIDRIILDEIPLNSKSSRNVYGTIMELTEWEKRNIRVYFNNKKFPLRLKEQDASLFIRDVPLS